MMLPEKWRILWAQNPRAVQLDRRTLHAVSHGTIPAEAAARRIEYNNKLRENSVTNEILTANLIWLGYWNTYATHHRTTEEEKHIYSTMTGVGFAESE